MQMVVLEKSVMDKGYKHLFLSIKLLKTYDETTDNWKTAAYLVRIYKYNPEQGFLEKEIISLAYPANEYKDFHHNFVNVINTILREYDLITPVYRIRHNIYIGYKHIPKKLVWLESWYKNSLLPERFDKFIQWLDDIIEVALRDKQNNIIYGHFTPFVLAENNIYKQLGIAASVLP